MLAISKNELAIDCLVVDHVTDSWYMVRSTNPKEYKTILGKQVMRRLFEKSPTSMALFGVEADMIDAASPEGQQMQDLEEFIESPKGHSLAGPLITMLGMAVEMLGPDLEIVSTQLVKLGSRHAAYDISEEEFKLVGQGLIEGIKIVLGDEFSDSQEKSWETFYAYVSEQMMEGVKRVKARIARRESRKQKKLEREAKRSPSICSSETASTDGSSTGDVNEEIEFAPATLAGKVRQMFQGFRGSRRPATTRHRTY